MKTESSNVRVIVAFILGLCAAYWMGAAGNQMGRYQGVTVGGGRPVIAVVDTYNGDVIPVLVTP